MSRWNDCRREQQAKRMRDMNPQRNRGRKTGRRFDDTAIAGVLMLGPVRVRSW